MTTVFKLSICIVAWMPLRKEDVILLMLSGQPVLGYGRLVLNREP